jgi:FkbM family methyltransferase
MLVGSSKWRFLALAFLLCVSLLHLHNATSRSSMRAAARRLPPAASSLAAAAAPAWFFPALDAPLSRCIRDAAPRYRAYIDAQFALRHRSGGGFDGGQLCNQCNTHIIPTWGQLVKSDERLSPGTVLDIGGNKGEVALAFLEAFPAPTAVISYELSPPTCAQLTAKRDSRRTPGERARWTVVCEGVAAAVGSMEFFSGGAGSPLSSLGRLENGFEKLQPGGKVPVTTVAAIMAQHKLGHAGLVKIDTEGWEREALEGMRLATEFAKYEAILFEYGEAWADTRSGPSNKTLAEVVEDLSERSGPWGFACFYVGLTDLLPISPPWVAPQPADILLGPNVLCLRRDAPIHYALLTAHRREVDHCLAGQGLWGPPRR